MNIAVVGGKLQGVEVIYLAGKAGYHTLLIDKNPKAPAIGLCHEFLAFEFKKNGPLPKPSCRIDLILPAVEDAQVLAAVDSWARKENIPLAFDLDAYALSSSKIKSNAWFQDLKLPVPRPWPDCSFPVVVKPDQASGSEGVEVFKTPGALSARYPTPQTLEKKVVQEFVDGPSFSVEVTGHKGTYQALQVTDLYMDEINDCCRVTAPSCLSKQDQARLKEMGVTIAQAIQLKGIMDLEVILNRGELKILEIDARFPSQTPMTVFWSAGLNMVAMLAHPPTNDTAGLVQEKIKPALVEHIQVQDKKWSIAGEHIMADKGPLRVIPGFFGAREALTNYQPGKDLWVATMVFQADSLEKLKKKQKACHEQISRSLEEQEKK